MKIHYEEYQLDVDFIIIDEHHQVIKFKDNGREIVIPTEIYLSKNIMPYIDKILTVYIENYRTTEKEKIELNAFMEAIKNI